MSPGLVTRRGNITEVGIGNQSQRSGRPKPLWSYLPSRVKKKSLGNYTDVPQSPYPGKTGSTSRTTLPRLPWGSPIPKGGSSDAASFTPSLLPPVGGQDQVQPENSPRGPGVAMMWTQTPPARGRALLGRLMPPRG